MSSIEIVDPCTDPLWERFASDHGSLFASPPWCRVLTQAFGVHIRAALLFEGIEPRCGLLVAEINDAIGHRQSTLPFADFCGPLGVTTGEQWRALTDALLNPSLPYSLRLLSHPVVMNDSRLRETARFAWHKVDLGETREQAWDRIASRTRQGVRSAERKGVVTSHRSDLASVLEFHRMHSDLRREKYAMLAQPQSFFTAIYEQFAGSGDLCIAEASLDGRAVAACFLLRWGSQTYYKFNTSRAEGQASNANDLALWHALNFAREVWKSEALDLGLSALDQPGLLKFKMKHATHTGDLIAYSMGAVTDRSVAARRLVNDVTALFVDERVPTEIRDQAAGVLYRHFS